ncbi:hypothetical protein [Roseovarius aestuariivivens]|uniref:hypothetical protein n=1 Tax=Roseovarius aestuariivivens TaxID=1888910 RepID=UPI001080A0DC|nr:hypothetical protein [Roseovarius aestuariivivens]
MSCAPAGQPATARLGDDPMLSGGRYTSGGGLSVAVSVREAQGRTLVCGVWAESEQQSILTKNVASRVIATGSIYLGNERVAQDLLFMRKVAPQPAYGGMESGCILSVRAWGPGDAQKPVSVQIPRQIVANEAEGNDAGPIVYFIQSGPAAQ